MPEVTYTAAADRPPEFTLPFFQAPGTVLGAGDTGVNRTDMGLPSGGPGPPTSGVFALHNAKQTERPPRGRSAELLTRRGLTHPLRVDAGF